MTGLVRWHHGHEVGPQRALKSAAAQTSLTKPVTGHTLSHSFATHLRQAGRDIRTVQELLGHSDPSTTIIYTRAAKTGGLGIPNPADE